MELRMNKKDLLRAFKRITFCVPQTDKNSYAIACVHGEYSPVTKKLELITTDGHRLSLARVLTQTNHASTASWNFTNYKDITKNLKLYWGNEVKLIRSDTETRIVPVSTENNDGLIDGCLVSLRTGVFPNIRRAIPKKFMTKVIVEKNGLSNLIKKAKVSIKLSFLPNVLDIRQVIEYDEKLLGTLPYTREGNEVVALFDPDYLRQALNQIESKNVRLKVENEAQPMLVQPVGEEGIWEHYLMPMRL